MRHRELRVVPLMALAFAAGCLDTDLDDPPAVVVAVFDPGASPPLIPVPNDLTHRPAATTDVAVAVFSGPIDPASLHRGSVVVLDVTTRAPVSGVVARLDEGARLSLLPPPAGWPANHQIAIAVRGSPAGLVGEGGIPVVASPPFFLARSTKPLASCVEPAPGCTSFVTALPVEQAIGLERLRVGFAPLLEALEALGLPRGEVVLAWTFTVAVMEGQP